MSNIEQLIEQYKKTLLQWINKSDISELLLYVSDTSISFDIFTHDNWNGGIDFYDVTFYISAIQYHRFTQKFNVNDLVSKLEEILVKITDNNEGFAINSVKIVPSLDSKAVDTGWQLQNSVKILVSHDIKFYKHPRKESFIRNAESECLCLLPDNWNDFGYCTLFELVYKDKDGTINHIGALRVLINDAVDKHTVHELPKEVMNFQEYTISMGCSEEYYTNLKNVFGTRFEQILFALHDIAYFPQFYDSYLSKFPKQKNAIDKSLFREDSVERMMRLIKVKQKDAKRELINYFSFDYFPPFSDQEVGYKIEFDFRINNKSSPIKNLKNRIHAFIGENGVGKTSLLNQIFNEYSNKIDSLDNTNFSKVIVASSADVDGYRHEDSRFYSHVCQIKELNDRSSGLLKIQKALTSIFYHRSNQYYSLLSEILDPSIVSQIFETQEDKNTGQEYFTLSKDKLKLQLILNKLSSGEKHMFLFLTEITAHIRYDSLLLIDEPEIHLHPRAVTVLMNGLQLLLRKFESYAIIATHSPLIIRELFASRVYVIDREDDHLIIRKVNIQTYGAGVQQITTEIFGDYFTESNQLALIRQLVKQEGCTKEELYNLFDEENLILPLNLELYIEYLYNEKN